MWCVRLDYVYEDAESFCFNEELFFLNLEYGLIMYVIILQVLNKMVAAGGGGKRLPRYPLTGSPKMSSIYGYLRTVMPILRYLGLTPVKRVQENGLAKYKPHLGVIYLIQVICECTLVSYLIVNLVRSFGSQVTDLYSFNAIELFACIMFGAHVVGSKVKTIEYRKECVESFDGIYEVDQLFKRLGIKTSYKNMTVCTKSITLIFCIAYPILLIFSFHHEAHFIALLLQVWRLATINMFSLFIILLYSKYRKLNKFLKLYIKENEEGIPLTDTSLEPLEVIDTVAEVYDKLCTCGKNWNAMHNTALSINLLFYSIAATLFSIAYYTSPNEMVSMIPAFVFLFFEFFYVLTVSQITRNECQKIMLNINEMSCCYIDNDLWRARNSFLLQTLHQRVNFTVLHVFPLDYSMAIKIGGIVLSVLVLTIQIRSLEEMK